MTDPLAKLSIVDTPVMQNSVLIKLTKKVNTVEGANNTIITSGKKTDYLDIQKQPANLVTNNTRQVFGQVAGINIWENDGSGLQTNVATRGLSPNRSWEFNVRQNGIDISSEIFGYPEAYYQPTFEAVDHIEIVRGAAGLQFGPQFGGLLNYVLKEAPKNRKISYQGNFTGGTYGLLGTYQQIGGTLGKLSYFGYGQYRRADGWRENSEYQTSNFYGRLDYAFSAKTKVWADYTRSSYFAQQAGGLNDSSFRANPQGSNRARNWFNVPWQVISVNLEHYITDRTVLTWKNFGIFGERNSVGNTAVETIADLPNATTGEFSARRLDRDRYENYGSELRLKTSYTLFGKTSSLATGARYYRGELGRSQNGLGTRGSDFDLSTTRAYGTNLSFITENIAFFAENKFQLTNKFAITAGARYENIVNNGKGTIDTGKFNSPQRTQSFVLLGAGAEYKLNANNTLYGNISQSYRPITFSDFTNNAANTIVIDPNLKAASGYSADLGLKGYFNSWLGYDAGVYFINYDNRVGNYTVNNIQTRANIGTSVHKGIEAGIDILPFELFKISKAGNLKLNYNLGLLDARYVSWEVPTGVSSQDGRWVENAPGIISRVNVNYSIKKLSALFSWSHVGETYSDANNSAALSGPNSRGVNGKIPSYNVLDLSVRYDVNKIVSLSASINNLTNNYYFTRRAGGYPGPGILPADGRTALITFGIKL